MASGSTLNELSILLTWNADVSAGLVTTLANLDLDLYSVVNGTKTEIDYSNSTVDNVELLYEKYLAAGNYAIGVSSSSSTSTDYALAWYMTAVAVPEPGTISLLLAGGVAWLLCRRRKMG